ncbi:hypothetical protein B0H13DRAFT_1624379 [Mycena leptocephala]|nr:hypothetical protein B0H13DRAFT_1624379 [Mycena leptocephala]
MSRYSLPYTRYIAHASLLSATRFLGLWDAVPLNSFKLRYSNSPDCATAADIYNFFSALSVGCSHSSLTTLVVRSRWDWNALNITDSRFFQIQSRALRTLFPFTNLTTVRIQNTVGFDLDDATVALLASSWPWLKQLELTTQVAGPQSRVTIGSLWYFARYCPCLEELVLTFDATVVQTPGDEASTSLFEHGLHSLEVETSAITSPIPVAEFILSIFPKLQRLEYIQK